MLDHYDIRLWSTKTSTGSLNFGPLRRLTLVNCENVMSISWQRYPRTLDVLEIVDPATSYPVNAGIFLTEDLFAMPLSHFSDLSVLNLQNVGAPIIEVLLNLCESGKKLKFLKLHDQETSGIDRCYRFGRGQPRLNAEHIDCDFTKLLVHTCPNLQTLSVDISSNGLEQNTGEVYLRRSDSRSVALEPVLEEMAAIPALSISEALRSLEYLRFLKLMTPFSTHICNGHNALMYAERVWSANLQCFTLAASPCCSGLTTAGAKDVDHDSKKMLQSESRFEWCVRPKANDSTFKHRCLELQLAEIED